MDGPPCPWRASSRGSPSGWRSTCCSTTGPRPAPRTARPCLDRPSVKAAAMGEGVWSHRARCEGRTAPLPGAPPIQAQSWGIWRTRAMGIPGLLLATEATGAPPGAVYPLERRRPWPPHTAPSSCSQLRWPWAVPPGQPPLGGAPPVARWPSKGIQGSLPRWLLLAPPRPRPPPP
jgi:hypothetical protein